MTKPIEVVHDDTLQVESLLRSNERLREEYNELARKHAAAVHDIERLTDAVNRIGFYFAGNKEHHHVSEKCLGVLAGKTITQACEDAAKAPKPSP
jgi:hypothetical protein